MKLTAVVLLLLLTPQIAAAHLRRFEHIILIVQENRTPDNLFQGLCAPPFGRAPSCSTSPGPGQYNIQTHNWLNENSPSGVTKPHPVKLASTYDLTHTHHAFMVMCDAGPGNTCRMDGADFESCAPACPKNPEFGFVENTSGILNPYLELATQYGWANYMFQTNQGPSFPAHQYLFGGTSAPNAADDAAGIFAAENGNAIIGSGNIGCASPVDVRVRGKTVPLTVRLIGPDGEDLPGIYPCFERPTIVDLLPSNRTWRYYSAGSDIWTAPNAIQHICGSSGPGSPCTGKAWSDNVDTSNPADVLRDVANCQLRSLSWVTPTGQNSDHAGDNDGGGPSWVASIVNAIGTSTTCDGNTGYWLNTAILITWDDWGGWYDHEPPRILSSVQGDYERGFRVPLIAVSAYTRRGFIDNQRLDFGGILRFIEGNFRIARGALDFADARTKRGAGKFFDLNRRPRTYELIAAPKTAAFFLNDKRAALPPDND
jgi:phospholipase C